MPSAFVTGLLASQAADAICRHPEKAHQSLHHVEHRGTTRHAEVSRQEDAVAGQPEAWLGENGVRGIEDCAAVEVCGGPSNFVI